MITGRKRKTDRSRSLTNQNIELLALGAANWSKSRQVKAKGSKAAIGGLLATALFLCAGVTLLGAGAVLAELESGDGMTRQPGSYALTALRIRNRAASSSCPTPEFSAPSRFGVARGPSRWMAVHAAELLDRVGERVQREMGLEQPGFVDLRIQLDIPEHKVAGHASPGSATPHVCIEETWALAEGECVLAHELSHLWRGTHKALPVLEEGKADLVALRSFPLHAAVMLRSRKSSLRKLLRSPAGRSRGGQLLVEAALAPRWEDAMELLGMEDDQLRDVRNELYALGLELALRVESGEQLNWESGLTASNSVLLAVTQASR